MRFSIAIALAIALAACQPVPRPFSHDGAPNRTILAVPDHGGIIVMPVADAPEATSSGLVAAMVDALHDANVPASASGGNRHSHFLQGRVEDDGRDARLVWELYDGAGKLIGTASRSIEGTPIPAWAHGQPELMAALVGGTAPEVASFIQKEAPRVLTAARIVLRPVSGAPGDGNARLTEAMEKALGKAGFDLAGNPGPDTFEIIGNIGLDPGRQGRQEVEISWQVLDPRGTEVGVVAQQNTIAAGSLDRRWGAVADAIAEAAALGVADLLAATEMQSFAPRSGSTVPSD
ncbi:MAG: hypothetical protein ACE5Q3_06195 [Alphaproteobacteria bacterium]